MADHRNADAPGLSEVPAPQQRQAARHTAEAVLRDITIHLDPDILRKLKHAVLDPAPAASKSAVSDLLANGVRREDIADFYIPAVARDMGERWCSDQMSFAKVTIGASRLQGMLRELGPNWSGDKVLDPLAPTVLVVVPQEVYHTLGALILCGQLRRKGISVKLSLGEHADSIAQRLRQTKYSAMFLSASQSESLEALRHIVDVIGETVKAAPPIVIGGGILETQTTDAITALTGAKFATNKVEQALQLCGITVPKYQMLDPKNGV